MMSSTPLSSNQPPLVNTRKAERREVHLDSLEDLRTEVNRLEQAARASGDNSKVRLTGNWTLAQNIEHMALSLEYSLDGFPFKAPLMMRLIASIPGIKGFAIRHVMMAGLKLPAEPAGYLVPPPDITNEQAFAHMHRILDERLIAGGERFRSDSPLFGRMTHEQTTTLQLRHCALHLSFTHILQT